MLNRIKTYIVPLTLAASALIFVSTALAVDSPKQASSPGKLRACQARESAIKTRMSHLTQLATNMMNKFDKHAQRVEKYYTDKVVPAGKTVSNYNSLVADISTKKTAVQTVLNKAQTDTQGFSCATANAKTQMTQFRQDMQQTKKTLKDFRTSIKNLIVAVHTATGGKTESTGSTSMKENK